MLLSVLLSIIADGTDVRIKFTKNDNANVCTFLKNNSNIADVLRPQYLYSCVVNVYVSTSYLNIDCELFD